MRWFRLYTEVLDDPKVQTLPGDTFKRWVNILCLARLGEGILPKPADIAFCLRISQADAEKTLAELRGAGLLDATDCGLQPHNWNRRQWQSDDVAARVRRHRARRKQQRNVTGNVAETVGETPPDSDTDTDTDSESERATDSGQCSASLARTPSLEEIQATVRDECGYVPDLALCKRIRKALGPATLCDWKAGLHQARGRIDGAGLLPHLAADARKSHEAGSRKAREMLANRRLGEQDRAVIYEAFPELRPPTEADGR